MTDLTTDPIYVTDALIAEDIDAYLEQHQHKLLLRFITCGSVDDGKSTLIGRLLYDSKMIFGTVSAVDRTAPVQGEQPSDRIRHMTFCIRSSPSRRTNGCSSMSSDSPRAMTSRSFAK